MGRGRRHESTLGRLTLARLKLERIRGKPPDQS
jgi:hypothetical protein